MPDELRRPIRIQIPSELGFSQNEIDALELAFRTRLVDVESPVELGASVVESINTTRFAVEVEVVAPMQRVAVAPPAATEPAAAPQTGGEQPGAEPTGGEQIGEPPQQPGQ